jgi:diguanylate cyclase (GGDEF)-like protein/PAS domain S-box-containing protein
MSHPEQAKNCACVGASACLQDQFWNHGMKSFPHGAIAAPASGNNVGWVLLASVLLLNILAISTSLHQLDERRLQDRQLAEAQTQNLALAISQSILSRIALVDQSLRTIASEVEANVPAAPIDSPSIKRFVSVQERLLSTADAILVADAQGNLRVGRGLNKNPPVNVADRDYFIHHQVTPNGGLLVSKPLLGRIDKQWLLTLSRRINRPDGSFGGVVLAAITVESLRELLSKFDVGRSGSIALRTSELEFITRHPTVLRGQTLEVGDKNVSRELQDLNKSDKTTVIYHTVTPFDQVRRVFTFHRLAGVPLVLLVGMAEEDYLARWYKDRQMTVALLSLFFVVTTLSAVFLWRAWRKHRAAFDALARAEARMQLFATVFRHGGEAFVVTDHDNRIVEVNDAFTKLTGYTPDEVIGRNPSILASGRTTPDEYRDMWRAINEDGFWQGEMWDRRKDGHSYPKWMTISVVRGNDGKITHHMASFTNISELKAAEDHIRFLAHHDTLTALPNRLNLQVRLDQILASARREKQQVAVMFIDLDHFKKINDSLGHKIGDALLIDVARRLRASGRDCDVVARLGGDEFVVVLTDIDATTVVSVVDKIMTVLNEVYEIDGHNLHTSPSIGISLFPEDGEAAEVLMKNADTAMYQAKAVGRNGYRFFTAAMNAAAMERLALENELRNALECRQFSLHFQPQIDVGSGRVIGVEALARWQHPDRGMIPPDKFIPVAEETGLIVPLGNWVLDAALRQLAAFEQDGLTDLRMAVNLSAYQLRDKNLLPNIADALVRHAVPPSRLELEITESVAMENPERTATFLAKLREDGIGLAIDDFGTGYSSLAYLKQLPLNRLKIDRSFVKDIEHDSNDAAICAATISLAHSLGLEVVAEGVETRAQRDFLSELNCDLLQGYYFARPLPADECAAYIRAHRGVVVRDENIG